MIIGELLAERYLVQKKIGQGGFASVFLGYDTKISRQVAIKVLSDTLNNESMHERFTRESRALARLNHPNILTIYDSGNHKGLEYLVMELVNGPSLDNLISKKELSISQVVSIALQICKAMDYAHGQGIIHRDLTLRNIMLDEEDANSARVKILDFGLVKMVHSGTQTSGNPMMGTPSYMAPEQVQGKSTNALVDIWAFGVGLYTIIAGCIPFNGEHPAAMMYSIVNDNLLEFPNGVPEKLCNIIRRCLSKEPESRPHDFGEIARELDLIQGELENEPVRGTTILSRVSELADRSSKKNPYLNRVMIKRQNDFYGRKKEVRKIYSRLDAPQPQSISIVGDRRIGKSSLLNYIYTKNNRKQYMQNHDSSIFVYLDFQNMVDIDVEKFIDFLFTIFSFETGDVTKFTSRPKTLHQLKDAIDELCDDKKRIIIMMDEFELITRNKNFEEDFFSFLRSLANSFRVAYITSSRDELQQMCHNQDISDSPFFNIFSNLPLRPFSLGEAMELIIGPSKQEGVPLEPFAEEIINLAGLFPFFLQIACSNYFEYFADDQGAEPNFQQIKNNFMEEALPHYNFVWERFDGVERENLSRIALGKEISTKYQYVNDGLIRRGYLVETNVGVKLYSDAFKSFLEMKGFRSGGESSMLESIFGRFKRRRS